MTKRRLRESGALVLAVLMSLGCASEPDPVRLEVFSWWDQQSERRAFEEVITLHEERHDHVDVDNFASNAAETSREGVKRKILAGRPPSTFQANMGADLLRWTAVDTDRLPSKSLVLGLDDLFRESGLYGELPGELLERLRPNPNAAPVGVPINIHRVNVLYYNVAREEAYARDNNGVTFRDLPTLCPPDLGPDDVPRFTMGAGTSVPFVLVLLAFENILPALTSETPNFYHDLFEGRAPAGWALQVQRALECLKYLSRSFISGHEDRTWADAVQQVTNDGEAHFTVMGDWANGNLQDALKRDEVRAVPFPGTEPFFVFTADTFPLPIHAPNREETREFLLTIASREAQNRFSAEKGSMPARIKVADPSMLGRYADQAEKFTNATKLLATSGLFPPYYPVQKLEDALVAMIAGDAGPAAITAALELFRDAEPLFARWQQRLVTEPATASP
jgi:glucose/mannose transport system substrate-binding protein